MGAMLAWLTDPKFNKDEIGIRPAKAVRALVYLQGYVGMPYEARLSTFVDDRSKDVGRKVLLQLIRDEFDGILHDLENPNVENMMHVGFNVQHFKE